MLSNNYLHLADITSFSMNEGLVATALGFLWFAWRVGVRLHENQKKLKSLEDQREKDKQAARDSTEAATNKAKLEFYETLERTLGAVKEENTQLRERMAKQEATSGTFKEQYDRTVVVLNEKNARIEELVGENARLKEENTQLKRRLHGKERGRQHSQHDNQ